MFTTTGGVGFRAINLRPARSLKGVLLATLDLPTGTHADGTFFAWALESGVTEIGLANLPAGILSNDLGMLNAATDDALLTLPLSRVNTSQLGWYVEITNGSTVVYDGLMEFGNVTFGT